MPHLNRSTLIATAGAIWFTVGLYLMVLGLRFLNTSLGSTEYTPFLNWLTSLLDNRDYAAVLVIALGLIVGNWKGRTIMTRAAFREIHRIQDLKDPAPLSQLYSARFYLVMAIMMSLGMAMKFLSVPLDIRGAIDLTVGTALIQGSTAHLKSLSHRWSHRRPPTTAA